MFADFQKNGKWQTLLLSIKVDSNTLNNYRPISLLSCLGKVFKCCVFKHLFNYLRDHTLMSIHQSCFTPHDCTTNQLVSMYHEVCTALENQNNIQLIFSDISKAFDKVWHKGLVYNLESVGITICVSVEILKQLITFSLSAPSIEYTEMIYK